MHGLIGVGSRFRSASQATDLPRDGGAIVDAHLHHLGMTPRTVAKAHDEAVFTDARSVKTAEEPPEPGNAQAAETRPAAG
jgi:hypothetical protein